MLCEVLLVLNWVLNLALVSWLGGEAEICGWHGGKIRQGNRMDE